MVLPWFCHGFAMVLLVFYHGFTVFGYHGFTGISYGFAMGLQVFTMVSLGFPMVSPWVYRSKPWFNRDFPWFWHDWDVPWFCHWFTGFYHGFTGNSNGFAMSLKESRGFSSNGGSLQSMISKPPGLGPRAWLIYWSTSFSLVDSFWVLHSICTCI